MSENKKSPLAQIFDWLESNFFFLLGRGKFQPIIPQTKKDFFQSDQKIHFKRDEAKEKEYFLDDLEEKSLLFWQIEKTGLKFSPKQRLFFFGGVFVLACFGLFTDNLLLSIISILVALLFWIFQNDRSKEADTFGITEKGVFANDSFYDFSSLKSFWIFFESRENRQELYLSRGNIIQPEIIIPIIPAIVKEIRATLLEYLPEEKPEEKALDYLKNSINF